MHDNQAYIFYNPERIKNRVNVHFYFGHRPNKLGHWASSKYRESREDKIWKVK